VFFPTTAGPVAAPSYLEHPSFLGTRSVRLGATLGVLHRVISTSDKRDGEDGATGRKHVVLKWSDGTFRKRCYCGHVRTAPALRQNGTLCAPEFYREVRKCDVTETMCTQQARCNGRSKWILNRGIRTFVYETELFEILWNQIQRTLRLSEQRSNCLHPHNAFFFSLFTRCRTTPLNILVWILTILIVPCIRTLEVTELHQ
jgi:hypothetical protein